MSINTLSKAFVLLLVSLLLGCASPLQQGRDLDEPASIANAPQPAREVPGQGLDVAVMPLKTSVELGEPMYLAVRITNNGREPKTLIGGLQPGEGLIEAYSQHEGRERKLLAPLSSGDFENTTQLMPGEQVSSVFPIFFGAGGWYFMEEGTYLISVQVMAPNKDGFEVFESRPVSIEVTQSDAGASLMKADNVARTQAGKFLLWRSGDHLERGIEYLTGLSTDHPQSALASYITAARIQNLSEPFANYMTEEVREPDCREAFRLRRTLNTSVLTENLVIEDFIAQARCHAESQDWQAARTALEAGLALSSDVPEFRAYSRGIEQMMERLNQYTE